MLPISIGTRTSGEIETYIDDNKNQSISITDPVPKPWENY